MADQTSNQQAQNKEASPTTEPNDGTSSKFAPREYKALERIQRFMRIAGRIGAALSVIVLVIFLIILVLTLMSTESPLFARWLMYSSTCFVWGAISLISSVSFLAAAECIEVLLDIQDNTYVTAFNTSIVDTPDKTESA
jgi:hypothetical protein